MKEPGGLMPFDTSVPNVARIYDYWLGGKDNFAADREAAERSAKAVPQLPWLSRENRKFLGRAVRLCGGEGITQFLDIGSGLPTMENVHEVAGRVTTNPRVVYADNDPVVVSHAQALLAGPRVAAIRADLTRPEEILRAAEVSRLIDFGQPAALLIVATLHFVPDEADPAGAVARLRDALAPGSYLVISHIEVSAAHGAGNEPRSQTAAELGEAQKGTPMAPVRSREQIAAFFGDLTLLEPGLVDVWDWRPDSDVVATTSDVLTLLGGVARKD
jgi:SAM-dependent methyltransferase